MGGGRVGILAWVLREAAGVGACPVLQERRGVGVTSTARVLSQRGGEVGRGWGGGRRGAGAGSEGCSAAPHPRRGSPWSRAPHRRRGSTETPAGPHACRWAGQGAQGGGGAGGGGRRAVGSCQPGGTGTRAGRRGGQGGAVLQATAAATATHAVVCRSGRAQQAKRGGQQTHPRRALSYAAAGMRREGAAAFFLFLPPRPPPRPAPPASAASRGVATPRCPSRRQTCQEGRSCGGSSRWREGKRRGEPAAGASWWPLQLVAQRPRGLPDAPMNLGWARQHAALVGRGGSIRTSIRDSALTCWQVFVCTRVAMRQACLPKICSARQGGRVASDPGMQGCCSGQRRATAQHAAACQIDSPAGLACGHRKAWERGSRGRRDGWAAPKPEQSAAAGRS